MATRNITHKVIDPSGTNLQGVVVAARPNRTAIRTSDSATVSQWEEATSDVSGNVTLTLEENSGLTPAGTWYIVEVRFPPELGGTKIYTILVTVSQTLLLSLFDPPN